MREVKPQQISSIVAKGDAKASEDMSVGGPHEKGISMDMYSFCPHRMALRATSRCIIGLKLLFPAAMVSCSDDLN